MTRVGAPPLAPPVPLDGPLNCGTGLPPSPPASSSPTEQQHTVETALRLGSDHLDVGQRPEEGHLVLADPEGNPFCVIEPGNSYLAGCGLLGELACDGTRDVGLFWSAALGWPLVWDQDQETAIQSPRGGTKIAWGGSQDTPMQGRDRQRFDLIAPSSNQDTEVERLMSLGAARLGINQARVVAMTDPDGKQFSVRAGRPLLGGQAARGG